MQKIKNIQGLAKDFKDFENYQLIYKYPKIHGTKRWVQVSHTILSISVSRYCSIHGPR